MPLRKVYKAKITCDGFYPPDSAHQGQPCPCDITLEGFDLDDIEDQAKNAGWHQDHRGWICNAGDGHRDDRSPT